MQSIFRTRLPSAPLWLSLALTFSAVTVLAADSAAEHNHDHGAAPSSSSSEGQMPAMSMHEMQAMHAKMMAAKTPAERRDLMAAHMKAMQDGMKAMQQMGKDSSSSISTRMDMMTMMMQMMMDRQQMMSDMGMGNMGGAMGMGMGAGSAPPPTPNTPSKPKTPPP